MAAASRIDTNKVSNSSHSHLHDDIALSILSKLPIKSLTRFTCAQKSWSLLFQNPTFMNMFRTNFFIPKHGEADDSTRLLLKEETGCYTPQEYLCVISGERFENRVSLDWPPPIQEHESEIPLSLQILGSASVNGALCLNKGLKTVLWNPATAEFRILPLSLQPEFMLICPRLQTYELQPYKDIIPFQSPPRGFGYDSVRDDFKVIRKVQYPSDFKGEWVYLPNKDDPFWDTDLHDLDMNDNFWEEKRLIVKLYDPFWELYSLKSNSWRKINGVDDMPISSRDFMSLVNMNRFCHWLRAKGPNIVSFDFSKETFIATPLPSNSDIKYESMKMNLVELNGSLSYITCYDRTPYFHIWILGELGAKESWTKFFVVGPLTCSIISAISAGNKNRIFFKEEDSDEDFDQLCWFDLSTQKIEEIEGDEDNRLFCSQIVIYKENLHPFGGVNN